MKSGCEAVIALQVQNKSESADIIDEEYRKIGFANYNIKLQK